MSEEGFARMNGFNRSRIVLPLISLAFAFSAHAEEPNHGPAPKGPAPQGRPAVQAARPGPGQMHAAPNGAQMHGAPNGAAAMHAQGGRPPGAMPGRGPDARFARGAIVSHDFGGHAYRGRVGWEGGRWRH